MIKNTIGRLMAAVWLQEQGTSLIEMTLVVVLLGVTLLSLLKLFSDISLLNVNPDYRLTGVMLAQDLMEEIKSKNFDEKEAKTADGNWSTAMGPDAGESTAGNRSTLDDVDDYNGFSENMASPYSGFTRSVTVSYVNAGALNTPLVIPQSVPNNWTPEYKRVQVTATQGGVQRAQLVSVVGAAKSRNTIY